eukprot:gene1875-3635_t
MRTTAAFGIFSANSCTFTAEGACIGAYYMLHTLSNQLDIHALFHDSSAAAVDQDAIMHYKIHQGLYFLHTNKNQEQMLQTTAERKKQQLARINQIKQLNSNDMLSQQQHKPIQHLGEDETTKIKDKIARIPDAAGANQSGVNYGKDRTANKPTRIGMAVGQSDMEQLTVSASRITVKTGSKLDTQVPNISETHKSNSVAMRGGRKPSGDVIGVEVDSVHHSTTRTPVAERLVVPLGRQTANRVTTLVQPGTDLSLPSLVDKICPRSEDSFAIRSTLHSDVTISRSLTYNTYPEGDSHRFFLSPEDPAGRRVDVSDRPLLCMSKSSDGREVVVGGADHALYSIDVRDVRKRHVQMYSKRCGHTDWVTSCTHLIDGRVLSSGMDGKMCLWGTDRKTCVDLDGHRGSVSKVVSDSQHAVAFSCGYDCKVIVWSMSGSGLGRKGGASQAAVLEGHKAPVLDCVYQQGTLASGARDGSVAFWDVSTGTLLRRMAAHKGQVTAMECVSGSSLFVTGGTDGMVKIWDPREASHIHKVSAHASQERNVTAAVSCMSLMQSRGGGGGGGGDVTNVVTGGSDNAVVCMDARMNFEVVGRWVHHKNCVYILSTVGDRCVFSGDGMGMMLCYDVSEGAVKYGLGASENSAVKAICCMDNKVVTAGEDGKVLIFNY